MSGLPGWQNRYVKTRPHCQSEIDKKDLGGAAARDADAMVANTAKHDPDNLPATQAAAEKIKEQTHEGIMDKNRAIVDDVMNPSE